MKDKNGVEIYVNDLVKINTDKDTWLYGIVTCIKNNTATINIMGDIYYKSSLKIEKA